MGRPRLGIGVVVAWARWETEVLRAMESIVGSVRSSSEERGCAVSFPPSDLDRSSISSFKPSRTLRHILRHQASLPKTREFASFPHSRIHSRVQTRTASRSTRFRPSSEMVRCSPWNPPRRSMNSTLPFCARVDLVQDSLYPNELKVYKPAAKVVPTSPRLHPSSTLKSSFTTRLSV